MSQGAPLPVPGSQVRLLRAIQSGSAKNYMAQGAVVTVIPSPAKRLAKLCWVQGPIAATMLHGDEWEPINSHDDDNTTTEPREAE